MKYPDRGRVTEDTNIMEIAEARAMSKADRELLNIGLAAAKWFIDDDNTQDCLEQMQAAFRSEDKINKDYTYMAEWLEALLKCKSFTEFKELSNQSCIEWITFSMSLDGHEYDDIQRSLQLLGPNPMNIDWDGYED